MSKLRHTGDYVVDRQKIVSTTEERGHTRYASHEAACWVGWWKGGRPRIVSGTLRDISPNGAGVMVRAVPPANESVWFCPKGVKTPRWIEGSVVRVRRPGWFAGVMGSPSMLGLAFREPCSWDLLRSVMFELNGPSGPNNAGPPPLPNPRGTGS